MEQFRRFHQTARRLHYPPETASVTILLGIEVLHPNIAALIVSAYVDSRSYTEHRRIVQVAGVATVVEAQRHDTKLVDLTISVPRCGEAKRAETY